MDPADLSGFLLQQAETLRDHLRRCSNENAIIEYFQSYYLNPGVSLHVVLQVNNSKLLALGFVQITPHDNKIEKIVEEVFKEKFGLRIVHDIDKARASPAHCIEMGCEDFASDDS